MYYDLHMIVVMSDACTINVMWGIIAWLSSMMLPQDIYSTGITHYDTHMKIVYSACHRFSDKGKKLLNKKRVIVQIKLS